MAIEIKVPSPGESITEVEIGSWFVSTGDHVEKDQEIGEIESEKATLPLIAEESGEITLLKQEGETIPVGAVVCTIDTSKAGKSVSEAKNESEPGKKKDTATAAPSPSPAPENKAEAPSGENAPEVAKTSEQEPKQESRQKRENRDENISTPPAAGKEEISDKDRVKTTPVARKMMEEEGLNVDDIINGLRKITSREVSALIQSLPGGRAGLVKGEGSREENRSKISTLRRKLAGRLVAVKNETAMLTTFNEADMSQVIALRKKYQDSFVSKHGIKLGFMSFFTKAVSLALLEFPNVNSRIEDEELVTPAFTDIGIAVQTDKGLMVPVLRNVEKLGLAEIEKMIMELASRARKFRISIEEMNGGTFTITNGGIFGSMLSTPIINPPQAAILGMHNILERPVVVDGQITVRPMMYLALSYDHRVVDGRDSVSFLVRVKQYIENPVKMLLSGTDPEKSLLGL